ncbi:hypothetical protein CVS40_0302, partial [Lucilia cuprina]
FNLSSFTAFINSYVCIKVDPNGIPNGNYTTISLKSQTIQPYTKPAIINRNEADNFTLLGDTELSASERTRRLIPYMAFYVPVSELPINKQYASKNNIHATKQLARPSATGSTGSSFIPLPPQYVHSGMQYLPPAPSAASSAPSGHQHYQGNAGLGSYHTHGFGGQQQPQQQQQFHLLPPPTGHSHIHLQPPGPPGPSAASLPTFTGHGKGNGNNHNAFVTFKEVNPKRQKTVQHFPPLTSTASSPSASSSSYENIRQTSSIIKQQKAHHYGISGGGSSSGTAAVYRPRTKQSKINLTPFTPSNTVPGNFVPIVYTPVNSNNNNILNSHATAAGGEINDSSSYNQDENQQYPKQQHQLQHPRNQPQQIAIEYSSGPLPPSASATLIPIDVQPVPQRHHQQQQQQQHQHNPKQQSQFYSVSNSPVNVDLTHSAVGGGGTIASEDLAHHHQHNNAEAIRSQKPQYIDYVINEPQQSLDDEQQQHQHQLELLKPTLGPPSHAFILVTTDAPFPNEPVTQENYATSLRPPFKNKSKLRLQPVSKEKNVNYPTIREQSPTGRPHVVSITPTGKSHPYNDEDAKYVYVKEEFGQKLSTAQGGGGVGKLKPSNKYESDDNQIPQQRQQQHHHHHQQQQQQQQHDENMPLQTLATRQPITHHQQHNEVQHNVPVTGIESTPPKTILADPNELPDIRTSSLAEILHKLQESNHLPHTLTPDNIDNSIKTLIRILNNLKQTQTIVANPPQHHEIPAHSHPSSPDYDYTTGSEEEQQQPEPHDLSLLTPTGPNKHPGPSTGRPGIDYPNYAEIPQTSFDCSEQRYKGFFGDPETNCQVWHYCDLNGGKASFLCPNGTIFSQIALTCDWWFNVKCATTAQLYVLNERLYKYILPFTPKFPEDYSGPIVDKYLAMKFQEMEEKMRLEKEKALQEEVEAETETEQPLHNHLDETTTEDNVNRHVKSHPQQTKHESVNSQVSEQSSERNLLIDDEVDDISLRGTVDNFESTTIATMAATLKSEPISYSLKPIIVSSTAGPDYDEEQSHEYEKRDHDKVIKDLEVKKSDTEESLEDDDKNNEGGTEKSVLPPPPTETATSVASSKKMQITVEKVDVIEIKPDEATGHLIRDMLLNSKHKQNK